MFYVVFLIALMLSCKEGIKDNKVSKKEELIKPKEIKALLLTDSVYRYFYPL